jgi:hypothetical protein
MAYVDEFLDLGDNMMTSDKMKVINCKLDGIPATGE